MPAAFEQKEENARARDIDLVARSTSRSGRRRADAIAAYFVHSHESAARITAGEDRASEDCRYNPPAQSKIIHGPFVRREYPTSRSLQVTRSLRFGARRVFCGARTRRHVECQVVVTNAGTSDIFTRRYTRQRHARTTTYMTHSANELD